MSAYAYSSCQREHDAQYKRDRAAWMATLPADERRKLEAQGFNAPPATVGASELSDAASSTRDRCRLADIGEFDRNDELPTGANSIEGPVESDLIPVPHRLQGRAPLIEVFNWDAVLEAQSKGASTKSDVDLWLNSTN